ncbi:MAG: hypothetical protein CMN05_14085 [Roseibacillus sp.]|jgi:hypothetical protein|nr:hypothetical protein [Roseibacillus sp.]MDP7178461.1 ASCH domain-containing protein [Verrucomicrobiota bacterium]MDP7293213.1 ASCH domain-containing protein [Verrucomicrobiota bacterium]
MANDFAPRAGDRIMIFKPESLALVLQGKKTMDARKVNYKPGRYFLGCDGRIFGVASLQRALVVESARTWARLREHHRSLESSAPYSPKTYLFHISVLKKLPQVSFHHPQGAVNIVLYRP